MVVFILTVQEQAKVDQVSGAVNLKTSTASISKWVSHPERLLLLFRISYLVTTLASCYFSIMSEGWFQWQTMAPTPMVPSFSSHMPNSLIWTWSTQCLESMSPFCWGLLDTDECLLGCCCCWLNLSLLLCPAHRVIDGLETLDELEKQPVNEKTFRPLTETRIKDVTIHANPFAG